VHSSTTILRAPWQSSPPFCPARHTSSVFCASEPSKIHLLHKLVAPIAILSPSRWTAVDHRIPHGSGFSAAFAMSCRRALPTGCRQGRANSGRTFAHQNVCRDFLQNPSFTSFGCKPCFTKRLAW
jgi:hypothetical protein